MMYKGVQAKTRAFHTVFYTDDGGLITRNIDRSANFTGTSKKPDSLTTFRRSLVNSLPFAFCSRSATGTVEGCQSLAPVRATSDTVALSLLTAGENT
ncbi:hypothetical protein DPMN_085096 [Dreissena polymorpha]|uniref:Uncharacterized protein n=1 Tax=Dreissena polymorpha TaxID=45954 RepID=A0A9D3YC11_DREPO|nr:hypothetical protein DPMN_085096 [Dreissena polymorpha]